MFKACARFLGKKSDERLWSLKLQRHATGEFSMAVVQANHILEDQCQVLTSDAYTVAGVFDGHGGSTAAHFVNCQLIPRLQTVAKEGRISEATILTAFADTEEAFLRLVKSDINADPNSILRHGVGSCCIVGVIWNGRLYVANLGNSRAVMGIVDKYRPVRARRLTTDHNIYDLKYRNKYMYDHRLETHLIIAVGDVFKVKGITEVTKSIGDFELKRRSMRLEGIEFNEALLSAVPEVKEINLTARHKFVIFASDGFWDVMSDEAAVEIVNNNKRSGIAKRLIKAALHTAAKNQNTTYARIVKQERGSRRDAHDDISVVVLFFDHRRRTGVTNGSTRSPLDIFAFNEGV